MARQLKNLSNLFKNSRTRSILIVTIALIILGIVVGVASLKKRTATPAQGSVQGTPTIQSVPGGFETPETEEYVKLQQRQNVEQAARARKEGTSAVPTIVSAAPITGGWQGGEFSTITQPGQALPANYLLKPGGPADADGVPVYNAQGLMTGLAYGKGDKVCVMNCSAMGTVSPDGLIRDAKGNIIGKVAASALGTPVYDADGRLIGYAGADGKVRNTKGEVVGTVGPDGIFKDNTGQSGKGGLGAPVYDSNGRLIGYADPNGVVRGLNGNILGKVGRDGVARDANGRPIGKVGTSPPGTPVYDKNGNLIGYADRNGVVRDPNGKVIGNLAADGTLRDANGRVIGTVSAPSKATTPSSALGTPVYDKNGNLIGYADQNGVVRDANGRVIGNVAPDGSVRDANGNVIGTVRSTAGAAGVAGAGETLGAATVGATGGIGAPTEQERLEALRQQQLQEQQRQQQQQQTLQNQQQMAANMTTQQGLLFTSWSTTSTQQYVEDTKLKEEKTATTSTTLGGPAGTETTVQTTNTGPGGTQTAPFLKAGTVLFGILNTAINSDEPGPVMATIVGNRLRGGKLLGTIINQGQKVMLTFNVLTLPNVPSSISINAVAIDPSTARTALSSDTDNHYLLRYGSLFAASFMQGYGQAVQQSGAVVVSNGLNTVTNMPTLSPKGQALAALGTVGQTWGEAIRPLFNKPPTVQVYACTAMGVLILSDVLPPQ